MRSTTTLAIACALVVETALEIRVTGQPRLLAETPIVCDCLCDRATILAYAGRTSPPDRSYFGELSDSEFQLLQAYWASADDLASRYRSARLQGQLERMVVRSTDLGSEAIDRQFDVAWRGSETGRFRLDWRPRPDDGQTPADDLIWVLQPGSCHQIGVDGATRRAYLIGHGLDTLDARCDLCSRSFHHVVVADQQGLLIAPRVMFDLTGAVAPERSRVTSVAAAQDDDGRNVVVVRYDHGNGIRSECRLLPDARWAVRSAVAEGVIGQDPDTARGGVAVRLIAACDYDYGADGLPRLRSYRRERYRSPTSDADGLSLVERDIFTVTELSFTPASPEVFDIDALLGRKRLVVPEQRTAWWWWLLLNGFALFLIGGWLLLRRGRSGESGGA